MAMNWDMVELEELWSNLQEVDWAKAPRKISDFMPLAGQSWGKPASGKKWQARLKCNVYYYRANYVLLALIAEFGALLMRPAAMFSVFWCAVVVLCLNDPFARSMQSSTSKWVRRVSPELAVKMRLKYGQASEYRPGVSGASASPIHIFFVPRRLFVVGGLAVGLVLLWWSRALARLAVATAVAGTAIALHGTFRKQNLKAKFESARGQFTALWKEEAAFSL